MICPASCVIDVRARARTDLLQHFLIGAQVWKYWGSVSGYASAQILILNHFKCWKNSCFSPVQCSGGVEEYTLIIQSIKLCFCLRVSCCVTEHRLNWTQRFNPFLVINKIWVKPSVQSLLTERGEREERERSDLNKYNSAQIRDYSNPQLQKSQL